jgi:hypothetical protein
MRNSINYFFFGLEIPRLMFINFPGLISIGSVRELRLSTVGVPFIFYDASTAKRFS